jgi:hypothetical protein
LGDFQGGGVDAGKGEVQRDERGSVVDKDAVVLCSEKEVAGGERREGGEAAGAGSCRKELMERGSGGCGVEDEKPRACGGEEDLRGRGTAEARGENCSDRGDGKFAAGAQAKVGRAVGREDGKPGGAGEVKIAGKVSSHGVSGGGSDGLEGECVGRGVEGKESERDVASGGYCLLGAMESTLNAQDDGREDGQSEGNGEGEEQEPTGFGEIAGGYRVFHLGALAPDSSTHL